jgi:hypothetical protein
MTYNVLKYFSILQKIYFKQQTGCFVVIVEIGGKMDNSIIPEQEEGNQLDVSANVMFETEDEALVFFQQVKQRLLNVNHWYELCELPVSAFTLFNAENHALTGLAQEGNYIRIDIPGPGTQQGEGYDWVSIEAIDEDLTHAAEILSMRVRPSHHPLKPEDTTAHFFDSSATSTFQVKRIGNQIYAEVHGRNETVNNKKGPLIDKVRNTFVALSAKMGFSFPQWKLLVEGLVKR